MLSSRTFGFVFAFSLFLSPALVSQQADSSQLSLERIFNSPEFAPERLGPVRWLDNAAAYVKLETDSATPGGRSLVRYDAASGKREVWVAANRLVPEGDSMPLPVEDYSVSPDGKQLLVFTNSAEGVARKHPGRFLDLRPRRRPAPEAGRRREALHPHVRQVLSRRRAGWRMSARTICTSRIWPTAAITQLTGDGSRTINQRHLRLGLRGGARPEGRVSLEPRRPAHCLLAARRIRRPRLPADQQHRFARIRSPFRFSTPRPAPPTRPRASVWSAPPAETPSGSACRATPATTTSPGWSGPPTPMR